VNCADYRLSAVSDDPQERARAAAHAASCAACGAIARADAALLAAAREWRDAAPAPSPALERRIRDLAASGGAVRAVRAARPSSVRWRARSTRWIAAAAVIVLAFAGLWLVAGRRPAEGPARLLLADAIEDAERAERAHAAAIARLSAAASPILARANDPGVPAREAARLLAWRDRLASLDRTIREIEEFVAENNGNAAARAALLAAYRDKTDVLRAVLTHAEADSRPSAG